MYRLLLVFLLIGNICQAQIQFWTRDEIVEKQFQEERKAMGIKAAYNFVTSENWTVRDSTDYHEIYEYDREGRKTVYKIYKTDWVKKQKFFQMIDSFFYNDKGIFMGMKRYSPGSGGGYYVLEYAAKTILDAKGRITRINYYGGYGASELNDYHVYTYDAKNKVTIVAAFDAMKKKTADWKISYDPMGRV